MAYERSPEVQAVMEPLEKRCKDTLKGYVHDSEAYRLRNMLAELLEMDLAPEHNALVFHYRRKAMFTIANANRIGYIYGLYKIRRIRPSKTRKD